jgi:hypothetical protein
LSARCGGAIPYERILCAFFQVIDQFQPFADTAFPGRSGGEKV